MTLIKRNELPQHLENLVKDDGPRIFLFHGERYLCRQSVDLLEHALLQAQDGTVYPIDGDREDPSQTLAKLMSFSLLPGRQIYRVNDTRLFHSKNIAPSVWQKARQAFENNRLPQSAKYLADLYALAAIDREDRQPFSELSESQWREMFGMDKPAETEWTAQLAQHLEQQKEAGAKQGDLAQSYIDALKKGMPHNNILILTSESIDKRKRLFTFFKDHGLVVDCTVAEGASASAQRVQKSVLQEVMQDTLQRYGKTMAQGALEILIERVGFHPVAVAMETEKLALYCDDRKTITLADLDLLVGRSREDALFELTDHIGKRELGKSLHTLSHLLENGVHSLAILATLRNFYRKLLLFRSLQFRTRPLYQRGMNAKIFQERYLPELKSAGESEQGEWLEMLKGHPYALFMSFNTAAGFTISALKTALARLLEAEYRLKGSGITEHIVLEELLFALLQNKPEHYRQHRGFIGEKSLV